MSQITYDRFPYGADAQDHALDLICHCASARCKQTIHFGDEVYEYDSELYCSPECLIWDIGGTKVKAGMEELA